MSRSVRKTACVKYGANLHESWKKWKKYINRYNRRISRYRLKAYDDDMVQDVRLASIDYDFCKWHDGMGWIEFDSRMMRK